MGCVQSTTSYGTEKRTSSATSETDLAPHSAARKRQESGGSSFKSILGSIPSPLGSWNKHGSSQLRTSSGGVSRSTRNSFFNNSSSQVNTPVSKEPSSPYSSPFAKGTTSPSGLHSSSGAGGGNWRDADPDVGAQTPSVGRMPLSQGLGPLLDRQSGKLSRYVIAQLP